MGQIVKDISRQLDLIIARLDQYYQRIENRMDRFDKKLNTIAAEKKKEQWVRVSFILQATGWTSEKLRQAREQGIVKYEKRVDGFWYDLSSIPQVFFNSPSHDYSRKEKDDKKD